MDIVYLQADSRYNKWLFLDIDGKTEVFLSDDDDVNFVVLDLIR